MRTVPQDRYMGRQSETKANADFTPVTLEEVLTISAIQLDLDDVVGASPAYNVRRMLLCRDNEVGSLVDSPQYPEESDGVMTVSAPTPDQYVLVEAYSGSEGAVVTAKNYTVSYQKEGGK